MNARDLPIPSINSICFEDLSPSETEIINKLYNINQSPVLTKTNETASRIFNQNNSEESSINLNNNKITLLSGDFPIVVSCEDATNLTKTESRDKLLRRVVEIDYNKRRYRVNLSELSEKLNISRKRIRRITNSSVDNLIKLKKLAQLSYNISKTFKENYLAYHSQNPSAMPYNEVAVKIYSEINNRLTFNYNNEINISNPIPGKLNEINTDQKLYCNVGKDNHFQVWITEGYIEGGSAGNVFRVLEVTSFPNEKPNKKALKIGTPVQTAFGIRNGTHSAKVLNDLHSHNVKIAIVPAPSFVKGELEVMKLYSGDLRSVKIRNAIRNLPVEQKIAFIVDLLDALYYIKFTKKYDYTDIKPANMLAKLDKEGKVKKIVLADFDGVRKEEDSNVISYVHTKKYLPPDLESLPIEKKLEQISVYAFSKSILESFEGLDFSSTGNLNQEQTKNLPKSIVDVFLLHGMALSGERDSLVELKNRLTEQVNSLKQN